MLFKRLVLFAVVDLRQECRKFSGGCCCKAEDVRAADRGAVSGWGWEVGMRHGGQEDFATYMRAVSPASQQ